MVLLKILRFITHKFLLIVLGFMLVGSLLTMAVTSQLTDRETVKSWLGENDTYNQTLRNSLNLIKVETDDGGEATIASQITDTSILNADGLVAAVETGLGENFIQTSVESVIDGVYDWLEEDAAEPQFSIDLTGRQATVATALGSELTQQLGALEACTQDQLSIDFDVFSAVCRVPGLDVQDEIDTFVGEFVTAEDSLFSEDFTAEDLELNAEAIRDIPGYYNSVQNLPVYLWIGLLVISALAIVTAKTWTRGLRQVSISWFIWGGIMVIGFTGLASASDLTTGLTDEGVSVVDQQIIETARGILEPVAQSAAGDIGSTGRTNSLIVVLVAIVAFVASFVLPRLLQRRKGTILNDTNQPMYDEDATGEWHGAQSAQTATEPAAAPVAENVNSERNAPVAAAQQPVRATQRQSAVGSKPVRPQQKPQAARSSAAKPQRSAVQRPAAPKTGAQAATPRPRPKRKRNLVQ